MPKILLAFHGDEKRKERYLKRVQNHYTHDEIVKGLYWENGKGCAVGCTIQGNDHKKYETLLGIPEAIARLEDTLFEGMGNEKAKEFPLRFLSAIAVGSDLSLVLPKFYIRILTDKDNGVRNNAFEDGKKAIDQVVAVHESHISTGSRDEISARSARSAAWSAARSARYDWMADVLIEILENTK